MLSAISVLRLETICHRIIFNLTTPVEVQEKLPLPQQKGVQEKFIIFFFFCPPLAHYLAYLDSPFFLGEGVITKQSANVLQE